MIANRERFYEAWQGFQATTGGTKRPESEAEYDELIALINDLTSRYNCNKEPWGSLFDLLAGYAHEWELQHEPLKQEVAEPYEMLAHLMEQHGLTQSDLVHEGIADQTTLSKVLNGKRAISKTLAKRLAQRFNTSLDMFL